MTVELNEIAQTMPAGHRLRLAVSTSYWPIAWPSPELATVTIDPARSSIELPVLTSERGLRKVEFAPAEQVAAGADHHQGRGAETRHMILDIEKERTNFIIKRNDGTYVIDEIGTEISLTKLKDYAVSRDGRNRPARWSQRRCTTSAATGMRASKPSSS